MVVPCLVSGEEPDSKNHDYNSLFSQGTSRALWLEPSLTALYHHRLSQKPSGNFKVTRGIDEIGGCEQTTQHADRFERTCINNHSSIMIHPRRCREPGPRGRDLCRGISGPRVPRSQARRLANKLPSILIPRIYSWECAHSVIELGSNRLCIVLAKQVNSMAQSIAGLNLIRKGGKPTSCSCIWILTPKPWFTASARQGLLSETRT
ncbi:hypothetical protein F5144DRAFT_205330 [Chaetomium tenue]|uniref:Uncharacterized protein n=1 Tax=Chaetomium tenue TaxID=1854479 RepID=A0ACB7PD25_9PEZI|nr:hypothetical protein F5144DRAFT_205330 [Chaetomium globosum]